MSKATYRSKHKYSLEDSTFILGFVEIPQITLSEALISIQTNITKTVRNSDPTRNNKNKNKN